MRAITRFIDEYSFLSNFYPSPIGYGSLVFATVEHGFQALKTLDASERRRIAGLATPGLAKRAGRSVALRPDWDAIRLDVMAHLLALKFAPGSELTALLLSTGSAELVEGNDWGDRFWGAVLPRLEGSNHLGVLLMARRAELSTHD